MYLHPRLCTRRILSSGCPFVCFYQLYYPFSLLQPSTHSLYRPVLNIKIGPSASKINKYKLFLHYSSGEINAQCIILPLTSFAPEKQGDCARSCMASYGSSYIIDLHLAIELWKSLLNKPCHSLGILHTCRLRYIALT